MARVLEVCSLQEHLMQLEAQSAEEAEEWWSLLKGEVEAGRQWEEWLVSEAALGSAGILCWVWEHQILLDGASAVFASIQDRFVQMPMDHPSELDQEVVRMGWLLAGHQQHNAVALESWWEVVVDVEEELPGLAEVLAMVRAQMEVDLGGGRE
ncbi:hypothetical protein E4T56_gene17045 [Termitomyces sp. T112]|nr:hypothetical protein E4T56_gene17045 [Termitomyces sp. T112]